MKIVYLHGFASSGASGTVQLLRRVLPSAQVVAPDLPVDPTEALPMLLELCERENPDVVVGTSMGGMYAQQMRGRLRVCVNPAFHMSTLSRVMHTGRHQWLNGRQDGAKTFEVTRDTLQHFCQMERRQFDGVTPQEQQLCYGLFGTADDLAPTARATFLKHYPLSHAVRFEGGHQLNERALQRAVLPLLSELLPEQMRQAREQPKAEWEKYC